MGNPTYDELLNKLKKDMDFGSQVSTEDIQKMIKTAMEPLLKAEEKALQSKVHAGNFHVADASGFVRTKQGSLVNPIAIMGAPEQRLGNYWQELSPVMEEYMLNFELAIGKKPKKRISKQNNMVVGDNELGGFLVPEEFIASIVEYREPANIVWPRATIVPMNTDRLRMPKLAQVSDGANLDHFGGMSFTWLDEAGTKIQTEPTFEALALNAHKLAGYTAISDELLADSPINLANFLTNLIGRAWMWTTDSVFINGNGAGKPMGVINDPAIILVARQVAGTVGLTDINNMYRALPSHFDAGAVWFADKNTLGLLLNLRDLNNALLIRESGFAVKDGVVPVMKGKQVVLSDGKTPALGSQGDVILGNWKEYMIGNRQSVDIRSSEHILFLQDMTAIRVVGRVDGQAAQPRAFVVLDDAVAGS